MGVFTFGLIHAGCAIAECCLTHKNKNTSTVTDKKTDDLGRRRIGSKKAAPVPNTSSSQSIAHDLAHFNNSSVHGQVHGIYITTNETNLAATRQMFIEHPRPSEDIQTIHIGCATWHNLDIMCARKSNYGLIVDFNPKNAEFIKKTISLINSCESRDAFKQAMILHLNSLKGKEREVFFHKDQKGLTTDRIETELSREGSWLEKEENYLFIKELVSNGHLIAISEDIKNVKKFSSIRKFLNDNKITIDTLYLSNICNFMSTPDDKNAFVKSINQLLNENTLFISCPKLKQAENRTTILHQMPHLGREILSESYDSSLFFEETIFLDYAHG